MRTDWIPLSASALVVGAMALVFGSLLNPAESGSTAAQTLRVVQEDGGRWIAMAVMFFFASVALTLGLPSVLVLFQRRGRVLGLIAVAVFAIGSIGTAGYAMLMVFFRAMVLNEAINEGNLAQAANEAGLAVFLRAWIFGFYGGVLLLAIALFVARRTAKWVPGLMLLFVAMMPLAGHLGRVGMAVQVMALAVAFTGIAIAAVTDEEESPALSRASVA